MSPDLSKAIHSLAKRAAGSKVTAKQRAIVSALREVGADTAADTIEDILDRQDAAAKDGLETVKFMKRVKPG